MNTNTGLPAWVQFQPSTNDGTGLPARYRSRWSRKLQRREHQRREGYDSALSPSWITVGRSFVVRPTDKVHVSRPVKSEGAGKRGERRRIRVRCCEPNGSDSESFFGLSRVTRLIDSPDRSFAA